MHTQIPVERLVFWACLILTEFSAALLNRRRDLRFLRYYLFAEAAIGATLWGLSRTIPAWPYFYAWCVASLLDQAASAYLLLSIFSRVRSRALPQRGGITLLTWATFFSLAIGIYTAGIFRHLVQPVWKLSLSWDHAFWCAACCMVAFLPFYVWHTLSTLRGIRGVFLAFAAYATAHAGLFDLLALRGRQGFLVWTSDVIYLLCVFAWFFASRTKADSGLSTTAFQPS